MDYLILQKYALLHEMYYVYGSYFSPSTNKWTKHTGSITIRDNSVELKLTVKTLVFKALLESKRDIDATLDNGDRLMGYAYDVISDDNERFEFKTYFLVSNPNKVYFDIIIRQGFVYNFMCENWIGLYEKNRKYTNKDIEYRMANEPEKIIEQTKILYHNTKRAELTSGYDEFDGWVPDCYTLHIHCDLQNCIQVEDSIHSLFCAWEAVGDFGEEPHYHILFSENIIKKRLFVLEIFNLSYLVGHYVIAPNQQNTNF